MSVWMLIIFLLLATVAIFGAYRMITSHHPVHSALYLVLNFAAVAALYLIIGAPFIALVQVAVYAGAIMVLFLFIIMYLNLGMAQDVADDAARRRVSLAAAGLLALLVIVGGLLAYLGTTAGVGEGARQVAEQRLADRERRAAQAELGGEYVDAPDAATLATEPVAADVATRIARARQPVRATTVEQIGVLLFSRYVLPFEVASVLLLVAMIGVLILARPQMRREDQQQAQRSAGSPAGEDSTR